MTRNGSPSVRSRSRGRHRSSSSSSRIPRIRQRIRPAPPYRRQTRLLRHRPRRHPGRRPSWGVLLPDRGVGRWMSAQSSIPLRHCGRSSSSSNGRACLPTMLLAAPVWPVSTRPSRPGPWAGSAPYTSPDRRRRSRSPPAGGLRPPRCPVLARCGDMPGAALLASSARRTTRSRLYLRREARRRSVPPAAWAPRALRRHQCIRSMPRHPSSSRRRPRMARRSREETRTRMPLDTKLEPRTPRRMPARGPTRRMRLHPHRTPTHPRSSVGINPRSRTSMARSTPCRWARTTAAAR